MFGKSEIRFAVFIICIVAIGKLCRLRSVNGLRKLQSEVAILVGIICVVASVGSA